MHREKKTVSYVETTYDPLTTYVGQLYQWSAHAITDYSRIKAVPVTSPFAAHNYNGDGPP